MSRKNGLTIREKAMSYLHSVATPLQQAAHVSPNAMSKSKTMNIALWILQVLWGGGFLLHWLRQNHVLQGGRVEPYAPSTRGMVLRCAARPVRLHRCL